MMRTRESDLLGALQELFDLVEEGVLVRNSTNDSHFPSYMAMSVRLVEALRVARTLLDEETG